MAKQLSADNRRLLRYDITEDVDKLDSINIRECFMGTGDAITKASYIKRQAYSLAVKSKGVEKLFLELKADADYLETSIEDGRLIATRRYKSK